MRRAVVAAVVGLMGLGCAGQRSLATQLASAAQPARLPHVVACWEKEFEAAGFQGEYVATVDFVVEAETSRLRDAKVTRLQPAGGGAEGNEGVAPAAKSLAACLTEALNRSVLPVATDSDGPGFATSSDLTVKNYPIAFIDASSGRRQRASARQAHVLLGPRADRCQGLYAHDPPRDASTLFTEVAEREAKAQRFAGEAKNRDRYARELQKAYDSELELRERLHLDALDPDLPAANRRRVEKALDRAEASAHATGALIGCEAPPLAPRP